MKKRISTDVKRRREDISKHYYMEIGSVVKKKRLEKKMTQEQVAKGIFSHTYLSKIENNAISINQDSLFLLMEKMDISKDYYCFPEEMFDRLEDSLKAFFYKDYSKYEVIYDDSLRFEYGILLDISRFGYYILNNQIEQAKNSYNEIHRYLSALESFGFIVYLLFSCYYCIMVSDFQMAREIYEQTTDYHSMNEMIYALFENVKFIVYGRVHLFTKAMDGYHNAKNVFFSHGAVNRLEEMVIYYQLFQIHESGTYDESTYPTIVNDTLISDELNFTIATVVDNPIPYLSRVRSESDLYIFALAMKYQYFKKQNMDEFTQEVYELIAEKYKSELVHDVDYFQLIEQDQETIQFEYKDFWIQDMLSFANRKQNLYFSRAVTNVIVDILFKNKRYKDAISYEQKYSKFVSKLKNAKR